MIQWPDSQGHAEERPQRQRPFQSKILKAKMWKLALTHTSDPIQVRFSSVHVNFGTYDWLIDWSLIEHVSNVHVKLQLNQ